MWGSRTRSLEVPAGGAFRAILVGLACATSLLVSCNGANSATPAGADGSSGGSGAGGASGTAGGAGTDAAAGSAGAAGIPGDAGGAGGAGGCGVGKLSCGASCIDVTSDPANCGACGHDCQGGACQGGRCQPVTLESKQSQPEGIAVDADHLYWVEYGTDHIMMADKSGASAADLLYLSGQNPYDVAVDASTVSWTVNEYGNALQGNGYVNALDLKSGQSFYLASSTKSTPYGIAVTGTDVYWTDQQKFAVMHATVGTNNPPDQIGIPSGRPRMIVAEPDHAYWTNTQSDWIDEYDHQYPASKILATASGETWGIAMDSTSVYWTCPTTGDIQKALKGIGEQTVTTLASGQAEPYGIAVDSSGLYWLNGGDGTVMRLAPGSAKPEVIASGQSTPHFIALDATSVYWTDDTAGTVMKLAK